MSIRRGGRPGGRPRSSARESVRLSLRRRHRVPATRFFSLQMRRRQRGTTTIVFFFASIGGGRGSARRSASSRRVRAPGVVLPTTTTIPPFGHRLHRAVVTVVHARRRRRRHHRCHHHHHRVYLKEKVFVLFCRRLFEGEKVQKHTPLLLSDSIYILLFLFVWNQTTNALAFLCVCVFFLCVFDLFCGCSFVGVFFPKEKKTTEAGGFEKDARLGPRI